jgi:hypothetical protein
MVFKDANEAAIQWQPKDPPYLESEKRILTIIKQAKLYVSTKGTTNSNKLGYLAQALISIEESITKGKSF